MTDAINHDAKRELELYAENTSELHNQFMSIIANVKRKIKANRYDPALAPKLWLYWYDDAARSYLREFGAPGDNIRNIFPKALREELAADKAAYELDRIQRGEYD